jgi:acetyl esterase/lipase
VNSSRLAVVGDSVGGNMTAAVTLLAKERRGPPITFQVLFIQLLMLVSIHHLTLNIKKDIGSLVML